MPMVPEVLIPRLMEALIEHMITAVLLCPLIVLLITRASVLLSGKRVSETMEVKYE